MIVCTLQKCDKLHNIYVTVSHDCSRNHSGPDVCITPRCCLNEASAYASQIQTWRYELVVPNFYGVGKTRRQNTTAVGILFICWYVWGMLGNYCSCNDFFHTLQPILTMPDLISLSSFMRICGSCMCFCAVLGFSCRSCRT